MDFAILYGISAIVVILALGAMPTLGDYYYLCAATGQL
jgi:hypothetical protein